MPPNILLILVDSARADAYRLNGGRAEAPALERLAAEGVNCPRAWATTPICHPSRASIITGLYPYAHGMLTNGPFAGGWPFSVRHGVSALPELLRAGGYRTGYAGQMHIVVDGWDDDRHEMTADYHRWLRAQGFDESPLPDDRRWHCGRVGYGIDQTREGRFGARGVALLDDLCDRGGPWFVQLDFDGPHPPCWLPDAFYARYDPATLPLPPTLRDDLAGRPEWVRRARYRQVGNGREEADWRLLNACYHGHITMIDELVGRVLDRLDELGVADDTLVVFTSDHATPIGYHGIPMHGGPCLYEDVLRIPLVVRWPAGLPAGRPCRSAVRHVDLVPTLLAAAGLAPARTHGRDALPAWRGEQEPEDCSYHVYDGTGQSFFSVRAWRQGRWKLVYTPYGEGELYDLESDPYETRNLMDDPSAAETLAALRSSLTAHMDAVGDPLRGTARADLR